MAWLEEIYDEPLVIDGQFFDLVKTSEEKCQSPLQPGPCPEGGADTAKPEAKPININTADVESPKSLKERGKELASKLGNKIWDKIPAKGQAALSASYGLYKKLEAPLEHSFEKGQELAKAVAKERGLSDAQVDRAARVIGWADFAARWTVNIPGLHEGLALTGIGGVVGLAASKVGYYVPVASLAYLGYSLGAETVKGKNPVKTLLRAREAVKAKMKEKEHG